MIPSFTPREYARESTGPIRARPSVLLQGPAHAPEVMGMEREAGAEHDDAPGAIRELERVKRSWTRAEARVAVFRYIDGWYGPRGPAVAGQIRRTAWA